ncbi:SDR family NAD(P)-dependent oxidoreductase, partial [bacterium M00.F.Ca.ET.141.01.1.1]
NKVAIVTGGSKGIGAAIAKALAAAGAAVVVNFTSSKMDADQVVGQIKRQGGEAISVQGDVSIAVDVRRLFETAKSSFGTPAILVNNAGVFEF